MEKRFFKATSILIIIFYLIGCKQKNKNIFDKIDYFIQEIEPIKDSIDKMQNYKVKLLTINLEERKRYNHLTLETPATPFLLKWNFKYKKTKGLDILLIDYSDTLISSTKKKSVRQLVKNNIITFNGKTKFYNPPNYRFVFCKDNISSIKCFGAQVDSMDLKTLKKGEYYYEKDFYPNCN